MFRGRQRMPSSFDRAIQEPPPLPDPESKYLLQLVNAKQALPKVKYLVSVGGAAEVNSIATVYGFGPTDLGGGPLRVYTPHP